MKTSEFKKLIKESVREAIKEELKDILLEAIKTPKQTIVTEVNQPKVIKENQSVENFNPIDARKKYSEILSNMAMGKDELNFNTSDMVTPANINPIEGDLSALKEVGMDQIMNLLNPK